MTQRKLTEKPSDPPTCPDCGAPAQEYQHEQTCLGWLRLAGSEDPNHHWSWCRCAERHEFVREHKSGNVWYTRSRTLPAVVLSGVPNCFERYVYADGTPHKQA